MEKHDQEMNEMQADHDEAMKVIEAEMKDEIAKNEDFQKAIDEMDDTLLQQTKEIDQAKQDLDLCISGKKFEDPEISQLQLELQEKLCEVSQLEEEIMHAEHALNDDSSDGSEDDDSESNEMAPLDQEMLPVDPNMTLRTKTPPQSEKAIPEGDVTVAEEKSLFTMPSSIDSRRVSANTRSNQSTPGRSLRPRRTTLDREVSSTQG